MLLKFHPLCLNDVNALAPTSTSTSTSILPENNNFVRILHSPNSTKHVIEHQHTPPKSLNLEQDLGILKKRVDRSVVLQHNKVHIRCLTKWVCYGGRIPSILQALSTVQDLDEALMPWQEALTCKEISIILKEQVSWERALQIFEWLEKKCCYELNVIHYNIIFRVLGEAQKWCLVESLWDEMNARGVEPVNSTYGTLIDVYGKGGQRKDKALVWLKKMRSQGMEPDEITMGIVVQLHKRNGEYQKAHEFFSKWYSTGEPLRLRRSNNTSKVSHNVLSYTNVCLSSRTYNTLIDMYGKAGQLWAAFEIFAKMIKQGVSLTTVTLNTMIHLYGNHGCLEKVSLLLQRMVELRCLPDARTYNILISVYIKHNNINLAVRYFAMMKETCLEPDLVSYRTLLHAYSTRKMVHEAEEHMQEMDEKGLEIDEFAQSAVTRMYVELRMLKKSWLWFRRFHLAGSITSDCYSAIIDAYGQQGYTLEAERVFNCCKERKKLGVLVFNVMIKAYGVGKCYDKACQLFDSMETYGFVADNCSYSSLIHILATADRPHIAKAYLKRMQEAGLVTDCIPYAAVITSFGKLGQLEQAKGLYKEMIGYNVQPDVIIYGVLINAFADAGSVKEAVSYLDEMQRAGFPRNPTIDNSLMKLYTKVGYLKEAQETYKLLQSSEQGPSIFSSNCMLDLYTERLMVEQAIEIFESLKQKGVANEFSYAMMLRMYKKIGRLDEAIQIAKQMRNLGLVTDLLSYNNIIGLYSLARRPQEATKTFKEMAKSGIQPDDFTFSALGQCLLNYGVSKQDIGRLEVMVKKDAPNALQEWMLMLSSVLGIDGYTY
ncbi:pentatricopeptide repeat-containing protein At3g23020-like [Arachis stenosperma]|uniref:pentatricopeptide repeat-containing protein At3g23020-like n=1 Tax=Arachis stenosperma TaxID=217475 RepID=UPI0025ABDDEB|nr:pentatricopeptide repeat-containing protein At3g23020-like [Arachis stenosperma]XP_057742662.1 pentatricopeptide repeat-containing protein At3g23020-like [Arachis stenosperma]XP_057742663.1 pentatricopeptide repeat-containing protein At3g23020-like [Arachis stenosperma]XP_057742664.1 pentatricopeptide repeat-containing protein At3g23020-like [Arachis stenosperma]XP_057742665.1 pentatricopeptide repeat-containing protein At3g23020-like [Arachis stenosperma]XP_057742666.1 pentatricopeptide re